jgi:uncharacterized membrane protein SirB2
MEEQHRRTRLKQEYEVNYYVLNVVNLKLIADIATTKNLQLK